MNPISNKRIPRKSLLGAVALVATLSAPLAFAQSADTAADPAVQPAPTAQDGTAAAPTTAPAKKSWNEVDVDQNGDISKSEAAAMPALAQVFDQADTDADGALTADEYKNYVAKVQSGAGAPPQG